MVDSLSGRTGAPVRWEKRSKTRGAERTAENAMTGGFIRRIRACAEQDARSGIYMSEGFHQMRLAHMRQFVSPDRSGSKAQVLSAIETALREMDPARQFVVELLDQLSGNSSARIRAGLDGQSAEIRASNGEVIASYSSLGGGWTDIQTREEHRFFSESTAVYFQAFREARARMRTAAQGQALQADIPALDVQA